MNDRYRDAIEAAEKHVKLGQSLQARGMTLINSIPVTPDGRYIDFLKVNAGDLAKLVQNANKAIETGVKIERESLDKLRDLETKKPQWS